MGIYIHIPFCNQICGYCDFCKLLKNDELVKKYIVSLAKEIDDYYNFEEVDSIYIGGGTPSSLSLNDLEKVLTITKLFKKTENCSFTVEVNHTDINDGLLKLLKNYGVNRLSIGIESFDPKKLALMEREANFKTISKQIKLCHYYGISDINVDFMYGIEGDTLSSVLADLKKFIKLDITHISCYSLILEDHTKFKIKGIKNVSEELESKMYFKIIKYLNRHGFKQYEVSNFSKVGFESVHNLKYWHNEHYYGFGLGASGYLDNVRYTNTENISEYNEGKYRKENNLLSKKDIMDNELMLGLRLNKGINILEFKEKYDVDIMDEYPINALVKRKDLINKNGNIYINPDKLYVMNEILLKMI